MATIKNEVFIGLLHENFYLVGRELTLVAEEIVPGAGRMSKFLLVGGLPLSPSRKNPAMYNMYVIYTCDIYMKTHNKYLSIYIYIHMHNHTLFILHILTYDFLRILPFLEIWIIS